MSEDPRPRIIRNDSVQLDFVAVFGGRPMADGGFDFGEFSLGRRSQPYMLTNAGYTPDIVHKVAARHPVPEAVAHIYQRPVLSVGLHGTGEKDIAHHYHPVTAMLLLQGEKVRALAVVCSAEVVKEPCILAHIALKAKNLGAERRL